MDESKSIANKAYMIRLSIIFASLFAVVLFLILHNILDIENDIILAEYILISTLATLFTFMVLEKLLHKKVIKPIINLHEDMDYMIESEQFNANIFVHSNNKEIINLAKSFNRLIDKHNKLQLKKIDESVSLAKELEFSSLIDQLPLPLVLIDDESKILKHNQHFEALIGEKISESMKLDDYFHKEGSELFNESYINWIEMLLNFNNIASKVHIKGRFEIFENYINISHIGTNQYLVTFTQSN